MVCANHTRVSSGSNESNQHRNTGFLWNESHAVQGTVYPVPDRGMGSGWGSNGGPRTVSSYVKISKRLLGQHSSPHCHVSR